MMQNIFMRTTVTLEQDVYDLAAIYAKGRGITLGRAIGELVRKGQAKPSEQAPSQRLKRLPNGLLVLAGRGKAITSEMVRTALEEDD